MVGSQYALGLSLKLGGREDKDFSKLAPKYLHISLVGVDVLKRLEKARRKGNRLNSRRGSLVRKPTPALYARGHITRVLMVRASHAWKIETLRQIEWLNLWLVPIVPSCKGIAQNSGRILFTSYQQMPTLLFHRIDDALSNKVLPFQFPEHPLLRLAFRGVCHSVPCGQLEKFSLNGIAGPQGDRDQSPSPRFTSRRTASGRLGLSSCFAAQVSISASWSG